LKRDRRFALPRAVKHFGMALCLCQAVTVFATVWDSVLPLAKETVNPILALDARLKKMQTVFSLLNQADTASIVHVKFDADGPEEGTSWARAYRTVQKAIDAAASKNGAWIWVAQGVYHETLDLKTGVILLGGFRGSEVDASDRNPVEYRTTLMGNGRDHVVFMRHKTMIDGFTITGGAGGSDDAGGGIISGGWLSVISNNVIIDNHAGWAGGGVYMDGLVSYVTGYSPILYGNLILHNSAKCGDGLSIRMTTPMVANNTIVNSPRRGIEVVTEKGIEPTVVNSIVWNNQDDVYNQFDSQGVVHGMAIVRYDCFTRSDEGEEGGGVLYENPLFTDSTKSDYSLRSASPCIDAGLPTGPKDPDDTPADMGAFVYRRHHEAKGVPVTFQSSPAKETFIQVDGQWYAMPSTLSLIPGSQHALLPVLTSQIDPGTRYRFNSWNQGGNRAQTFTVPQNASALTAAYAPEYYLKISVDPPDVPSPQGEGWYRPGSTVTLNANGFVNASPGKRHVFSGWTGSITSAQSVLTLAVNGPADETVHYLVQYRLEVKVESPREKGASVTIQPDLGWYSPGDSVALEAVAGAGLRFVEWRGDTVIQQNPARLRIDKPRLLTAVFEKPAAPPGVFKLVSPPQDTVIQFSKPIRFTWNRASDPDTSDRARYQFYLGLSAQLENNPILQSQTGTDTVLVLSNAGLGSGAYFWGVRAFNVKGGATWCSAPFRIGFVTSVQAGGFFAPAEPGLGYGYPNPFNAAMQIPFSAAPGGRARLCVYELSGRLVCSLWEGAGDGITHTVHWDGKDAAGRVMPSGMYVIRMTQYDRVSMRKVLFLK
jgi:hypothetical protein